MMTLDLADTRLLKLFYSRTKRDAEAKALAGLVTAIKSDIAPLLEYIKASFPTYPDHGINHSIRIVSRVSSLLSEEAIRSLSNYEIFAFLLAALFHDVGMIAPPEVGFGNTSVREEHPVRAGAVVKKYIAEKLSLVANDRLTECINFAIAAHGMQWDTMVKNKMFQRIETMGSGRLRFNIIAILLRIGDLLDLDSERVLDTVTGSFVPWIRKGSAEAHHERHTHVTHFRIEPGALELEVVCPSREQYDIWFTWVEYLRREVECANTYVFTGDNSCFRLPSPELKLRIPDNATYELWQLRFDIDESGHLWDILTQSVYTEPFDFIRELVQNALDACLRRIYIAKGAQLPSRTPKTWNLPGYEPEVLMLLDERAGKLVVADNGVGMAREDLERFLFKIAASGMRTVDNAVGFPFPSIATFGIGFISVLTRANNVSLVTRRVPTGAGTGEGGIRVSLDANLRDAIVERTTGAEVGTAVVLDLKQACTFSALRRYVRSTIRYPSVRVTVADLNSTVRLFDALARERLAGEILALPTVDGIVKGGLKTAEVGRLIRDGVEVLEREDERRRRANEKVPREKQLPLLVEGLGASFRKPIHLPGPSLKEIPVSEPIVIVCDGALMPTSIQTLMAAGSLAGVDAGVLIVPVKLVDNDLGIDWRSLHSFLFHKGRLVPEVSSAREERDGPVILETSEAEDPIEVVEKVKGTTSMDEEEEPFDMLDLLEARRSDGYSEESADEVVCDVLKIRTRCVAFYEDVTFSRNGRELTKEEQWFRTARLARPMLSAFSGATGDADQILRLIEEWYESEVEGVTQDGLRIPVGLGQMAPVGATAGVANLVADARLSLNVTRNSIDRTPAKLTAWQKRVGSAILAEVGRSLKAALVMGKLRCTPEALWLSEDESSGVATLDCWLDVCAQLKI
jgi:hypothetical protein